MNLPVERTIRSRRIFQTDAKSLWSLFSDPKVLGGWWGPVGFTNTFQTFEFREGGEWRFTMTGPDGSEYPMNKVFVNIEEPSLIVLDHIDVAHGFRMFIEFAENLEGTEMTWNMVFDFADEAARVRTFVEAANEQNFDRLNALLSGS